MNNSSQNSENNILPIHKFPLVLLELDEIDKFISKMVTEYRKDNNSEKAYKIISNLIKNLRTAAQFIKNKQIKLYEQTMLTINNIQNDKRVREIIVNYSEIQYSANQVAENLDSPHFVKMTKYFSLNESNYIALSHSKSFSKKDISIASVDIHISEKNPITEFNPIENDIIQPIKYFQIVQDNEFKNIVKSKFEILHYEFEEHLIEEAYENMNILKDMIKNNLSKNQETQQWIDNILHENKVLFNDIEDIYNRMIRYLNLMNEEIGWMTEKSKNGLTIKYKLVQGETISIKVEGIIDAPLFNFITVIYEPDAYQSWVPFCKYGNMIKHISKGCKTAYVRLGLPPPLTDREGYFVGYGIDRFKTNGTILIISNSFDQDFKFMNRYDVSIPATSKYVRMEQKYLGFEIQPQSYNKLKVRIVTNVDPKMNFIPMSLLNWFTRKLAMGLFERLISVANKLKGSIFEKYQNDPDKISYYIWLKRKIDSYFNGQKNQEEIRLS